MATRRKSQVSPEPGGSAARIFAANERMNQMLLRALAPEAWNAKPAGKVRSIAAIFIHMHNVRAKWIRLTAPHLKVPRQLSRARCTCEETSAALAESALRCEGILAEAARGDIKTFLRDGWAKPLPAGAEMLSYMIAHEAHHRGQVCMIAHQLGFKLPSKVTSAMWCWEKLLR